MQVQNGLVLAALRLEELARRTPWLRQLHRVEMRARGTPEQALTARMAWALRPVGMTSADVGLVPMLMQ
jgi:hypothetical protein